MRRLIMVQAGATSLARWPLLGLLVVVLFAAVVPAGSSAPAGSGLVAAYSFDDGTAADLSGDGHDGTVVEATPTTGHYGGALSFDGTDARVDLPPLGTFYTSGFTLEAWVKKASTSRVDVGVVGAWSADTNGGPMIWVDDAKGHYYLTLNRGSENYLDSGVGPSANVWQHVAATYDGSTAKFYVDGELVASKPYAGSVGDTNTWRIGAYRSSPTGFFDGSIDEVRVYDRPLTENDIQADMSTPLGIVDTTPPSKPTGLAPTSATTTTLPVAWDASTDDVGVTGYDVLRDGVVVGTTQSTSFTVRNLECDTAYTIAVVAHDGAGNSSPPASIDASTAACGSNDGLVASYSFDENGGSVLRDDSGNGRDGTIVGTTWTSGRFRSALQFDGVDDRVDLPALGTFYKSAFTIEGWVKSDSANRNDQGVVGAWDSGTGGGPMLWVDYVSSNLDLTLSRERSNYLDSGRQLAAGEWHYLTGTYDGSTARVYVDGVVAASKTFTGNVGDSNAWRIGSYGGTAAGFFKGAIDEVRIYDRALAGSEVRTDMDRSVGTPDTTSPSDPAQFTSIGNSATTISTTWAASTDDVAVSGYDLYLDGANVATTTSLAHTFGNLSCGTSHDLAVQAFDGAGNRSSRVHITRSTVACDTTSPSVSITAPAAGASLSGIVSVTAAAGDDVGVAGVQFKLDGAALGAEDTAEPYTVPWDTRTATNGLHTLTAVARDASGNSKTSTAVSVSVSNAMPLVPGLVASYALDDGTGTTASDTSGGGNPGALVGGAWVPGKFGAGVSLNGNGDRIDLPALGTFYKSGFTLEAWVKKASTVKVDTGIVGTWSSGANGGPMLWVDYLTGRYYLTLGQNASNYLDSGVTPSPGTWQHVAATYDGTTAKLYVDGVLAASKAFSGNVGDSNSWRIGSYGSTPGGYLDGSVDEVRIYDRALTQSDVQNDMSTPVGPPDETAPSEPPNFAVDTTTSSSIAASWGAATDDVAVSGYAVYRNGTKVETLGPTARTYTFDSLACASQYTLEVEATDGAGNVSPRAKLTAATAACDTTPPSVSVTSPADGSTVSGAVTIDAAASDDTAVSGVTFEVDGVEVGDPDNTAPYSVSWDSRTASNEQHTLTAVARDSSGNITTSAPVTVTVDNVQAPPPPGLVAAYGFDEGTGTTAGDSSGKGNTGTLTNVTWNPAGVFGSAASFNGTASSFVSIPDSSSLDLTGGMTIEAWVKPTSLGGWNTVVFKEQPSWYAYALYANTGSDRPSGNVQTGFDADVRGTAKLALNTWTHLAATYDGTMVTLYVNGVQTASAVTTGLIAASGNPLRIGSNSIWGEPFSGLIDEVRVYDQPLTAAQIHTDMNSSVSVPDTTAPSKPGTLTAAGGLGSVALDWGASTDDVGIARYDVYRSTSPGFTPSAANRIAQPAGTSYDDTALASATYYYKVTAEDAAGNVSPASNEASASVTADTVPPTVALTAPAGGNVSGSVSVSASASDNGAVAGVRFQIDGSNLAAEDTSAPYSIDWDTLTSTNGSHTLTAVARDGAGNTATSNPIQVTVENAAPRGLVAAYGFEESSGSTVVDSSGLANTGTLTSATRTAGKYGSGLSFNGSTSMVTVPDSNSLDLQGGMTLEAWVKPDSVGDWESLLFKEQTSNLVYGLYGSTGSGAPEADVFVGGASHSARAPSALPVNVWSHLAATYDGSNLRLYVDGTQVSSIAQTGLMPISGGALHMGGNNVWNERYVGSLDEVRVYNRALTASEIQSDMKRSVTPDQTPPTVTAKSPAPGATNVSVGSEISATFSESMDADSLSPSTFLVEDDQGNPAPGTVDYDDVTHTATFHLASALKYATTYTVTLKGGSGTPRMTDHNGNPLAGNVSWTFTTEGNPPPILVVTSRANDFTEYTGQILRAEGFNEYTTIDSSLLSSAFLAPFDVVVLGDSALTAAQVTTLTNWVQSGGNLIGLRPDKQLAPLLGLTATSGTLADAYLKVDTTVGTPGNGIVGQTIQFHGTADRYNLNGAAAVATLYSTASTSTANPAVTLRSVGSNGGQVAAFTYDLAKSIVLTRQGNPAWEGEDRDADGYVRSNDLFYGAKAGDVKPDWVDTSKIAIPQADEQQRLLANLIVTMNADRTPLPHLWYLPFGKKAAVVMTGDDHTGGGTIPRFQTYVAESPPGCSVANWECVRATSNLVPGTAPATDAQVAPFLDQGFEIADHPTTNCVDWNATTLDNAYTQGLADFAAKYTSAPAPTTGRLHCWLWEQYATQPKVELAHGIRFDENYVNMGAPWINTKPGFMTGSGEIMRFADVDGTPVDVWQAVTQMNDESNQTYPDYAIPLFDNAVGPNGYYGVFTTNFHTDKTSDPGSDSVVAAAQARGIPIVSAKQMLTWVDGRDRSTFRNFAWNGSLLTFRLSAAAGSNGMRAMLPLRANGKTLASLTRDGAPLSFTTQTIKGIDYAFFSAADGAYGATYN